ncbi:EF-hand domain-containing protein [Streptomyces sp. NPDC055078]
MADIEEARRAFQRYDLNGDGLITAAEYKSAMAQMGDFHVTESVAEAVIKTKDANGDGLLSFEEFWDSLNKARKSGDKGEGRA